MKRIIFLSKRFLISINCILEESGERRKKR